MRSIIIVAAIAAIAFGAVTDLIDLDFILGHNLTGADGEFSYRYSDHDIKSVKDFCAAYGWVSASVDAEKASPSAKASANLMAGAGALPSAVNPPFSVLAYGTGSAAVDVKVSKFLGLLITALKPELDASLQVGAVATAALSLQEYTADGKPFGDKIPLTAPLLKPCRYQQLSGANGEVNGITCTYTPSKTTAEVTVTYVSSEKAGILNYGKTPVSPRSYEMIIEVKNFPLSSDRNHVRMNVALMSATGAAVVDGKSVVVHGTEDLYSAVSEYAVVDNDHVEVKVTMKAGSAELSAAADAIIKCSVGRDYDAQIAEVEFPAGAKNFIYDPVVGVGANVYKASDLRPSTDSTSTTVLSLLAAFLCVILCFF